MAFRRLLDRTDVTIEVDGAPVRAARGETVAAALLAGGIDLFRRTPVSGAARGPYCAMGVCFDCLVTIDGDANHQACLVPVRDGMRVKTGMARPMLHVDGTAP